MTKPRIALERALARLDMSDPNACWIWPGAKVTGYGQIEETPNRGQRRARLVHVLVYEHFVGLVPDGHDLHHRCHQRACANWRHLTPIDSAEHGRAHSPHRGEFCPTCGWSDWYEITRADGRVHRECRECRRRRRRARGQR